MTAPNIPSAEQLAMAIVTASWAVGVNPVDVLTHDNDEEAWEMAWMAWRPWRDDHEAADRLWRALNLDRRQPLPFLASSRHRLFQAAFTSALGLEAVS